MQLIWMIMTSSMQRESDWASTYKYKHGRSEHRVNLALISSFTYNVTRLLTNCLRRTFVGHRPFSHIPLRIWKQMEQLVCYMDETTDFKARYDVVLGKVNKLLKVEEEKKSNVRHRRRLGPKVISRRRELSYDYIQYE